MSRPSSRTLFSIAILAASVGFASQADAKRGKKSAVKSACKMKYLPFVTGYTWTYQYAIPPGVEDRPGGIKARVPELVTVKVKSVQSVDGATAITLEESYRKVVTETVLRCDSKGLTVPLDSFFFAGELPGALGMSTEGLDRQGEMYPAAGGLSRGKSMYVEIKADIVRASAPDTSAVHPKAKLEIERQIEIGRSEDVEVEHGIHTATPVQVAISGRSALETTPEKKVSLPEGNAMLWFASGVGLVRAYNRLGQGWELTTFKDGAGANVE
ncbi:MAG: hypothetical protein GY811_20945 [Myxococcales bacterium]|nr:hypothetical protein [Myxococcales bacterium]